MPGEVYAFYIAFELASGQMSQAYHIPGRTHSSTEKGTYAAPTDALLSGVGTRLNFQMIDTASFSSVVSGAMRGTMGYWENINEPYPTMGDFPTGNVRHHRFPTLRSLINWGSSNGAPVDLNGEGIYLYPEFTNVSLPAGTKGYKIYAAKRSYNNSKVIGQGLVQSVNSIPAVGTLGPETTYFWPGYEGTLTKTEDNAFDTSLVNNYVASLSFDFINDRPEINSGYLQRELIYDAKATANIRSQSATFIETTDLFIDCKSSSSSFATSSTEEEILYIEDYKYIPTRAAYVSVGKKSVAPLKVEIDNYAQSEALFMRIANWNGGARTLPTPANNLTHVVGLSINGVAATVGQATVTDWKTEYFTFYRDTDSCYYNFYDQSLIEIARSDQPSIVVPANPSPYIDELKVFGDISLNDFSFKSFAAEVPKSEWITEQAAEDIGRGTRIVHYHRLFSFANSNLRYEREDLDWAGKFYPASTRFSLFPRKEGITDFSTSQNEWGYNIDYNQLNDIKTAGLIIHGSNEEIINSFPYRVQRSIVSTEEEQAPSWTQFLALDYYESVDNQGTITNIQDYAQNLIIHHERSLFKTRDKTKLKGDPVSATLGTGDIFELEPQQLIPTPTGYAGTQHQFSCGVSKLGYHFVDASMGKVFLLSDSLQEISNAGLNGFFRDSLAFIETRTFSQPTQESVLDWIDCLDPRATTIRVYKKKRILSNSLALPTTAEQSVSGDYCYKWLTMDVIVNLNTELGIKAIEDEQDYYLIHLNSQFGDTYNYNFNPLVVYHVEKFGDNPYNDVGYTMAFDEKYNRYILSKVHHPTGTPKVIEYFDELVEGETTYTWAIYTFNYNGQSYYWQPDAPTDSGWQVWIPPVDPSGRGGSVDFSAISFTTTTNPPPTPTFNPDTIPISTGIVFNYSVDLLSVVPGGVGENVKKTILNQVLNFYVPNKEIKGLFLPQYGVCYGDCDLVIDSNSQIKNYHV